jgi:hypothetical protein
MTNSSSSSRKMASLMATPRLDQGVIVNQPISSRRGGDRRQPVNAEVLSQRQEWRLGNDEEVRQPEAAAWQPRFDNRFGHEAKGQVTPLPRPRAFRPGGSCAATGRARTGVTCTVRIRATIPLITISRSITARRYSRRIRGWGLGSAAAVGIARPSRTITLGTRRWIIRYQTGQAHC